MVKSGDEQNNHRSGQRNDVDKHAIPCRRVLGFEARDRSRNIPGDTLSAIRRLTITPRRLSAKYTQAAHHFPSPPATNKTAGVSSR